MKYISVTPAYGRDYKNKREILIDLMSNKDFTIADISNAWHGKVGNRRDFLREGYTHVQVRYGKLLKVAIFRIENEKE